MEHKSVKIRTMTVNQLRTLAKSLGAKKRNLRRTKRFLILLCIDLLKWSEVQAKKLRQEARLEKRALKPDKMWYALAVRPRQERGARKRIRKEARKQGVTSWIGRMTVPVDYNLKLIGDGSKQVKHFWTCPKCGQVDNTPNKRGTPRCGRCGGLIQERLETSKSKGQRRIVKKDKRLPGYLLCHLSMTDSIVSLVRGVKGVLGFLPFNAKPTPLSDEEIKRVCKPAEGDPVKGKSAKAKAGEIQPGHFVRILKLSPFMDMEGIVKQVVQSDKGPVLLVELKVLGCSTPVKMEYYQVKRISELTQEE